MKQIYEQFSMKRLSVLTDSLTKEQLLVEVYFYFPSFDQMHNFDCL